MLVDFGLARAVRRALPHTAAVLSSSSAGGALGTAAWMAPENFDDETNADFGQPKGDVYARAFDAHRAAPARCARDCDPSDPNCQPYARPTTLNHQSAASFTSS